MTSPFPAPPAVKEPAFPPPLPLSVDPGPSGEPPTHPAPPFHRVPPTVTPLAPPSRGLAGSVIVPIIIASGIVGFSLATVIFVFYNRWKRKRVASEEDPPTAEQQPQQQQQEGTISLEQLAAATSNFLEDNIIGEGGFGDVYRGNLPGGQLIAVKKLRAGSKQGDAEFQAEVYVSTRIQHPNLVRLVGYCVSAEERLLAYEFMPNGTLKHHLHDLGVPFMDWQKRMRVAIGTAKCLVYMHEECTPVIIHRDIKASNILLGVDFEPKVSDFGLAKCRLDTQTHVSTWPKGTHGYLDPAYMTGPRVTEKADVFSFGVVLLELITGRIPLDETREYPDNLLYNEARLLLQGALDGHSLDFLVDHRLNDGGYNNEEMTRMVACAAACTLKSPHIRPKMSQVLKVLQGSLPLSMLNRETPEETPKYMAGIPEEEQETSQSRDVSSVELI